MATLLLITSTVILCAVVVDYATSVVQTTLKTDNIPQLQNLRNMADNLANQTSNLLNQTITQTIPQPTNTPPLP